MSTPHPPREAIHPAQEMETRVKEWKRRRRRSLRSTTLLIDELLAGIQSLQDAIHPAHQMGECGCGPDLCAWNGHRWAPKGLCKVHGPLMRELKRVQEENHRLRAALGDVCDALGTLRREAHGFLSMASDETHGVTNKRVLKLRIDEAYLAGGKAQALASERTD